MENEELKKIIGEKRFKAIVDFIVKREGIIQKMEKGKIEINFSDASLKISMSNYFDEVINIKST